MKHFPKALDEAARPQVIQHLDSITSNMEKEDQLKLLGASQVYRQKGGCSQLCQLGKVETATRRESSTLSGWRYKEGVDIIRDRWGTDRFIVHKSLGRGSFGEVYEVLDKRSGKKRAMKCTKLDSMTREQRLSLFLPLCEEALLGAKLGAHPNIIVLRDVISTSEEVA